MQCLAGSLNFHHFSRSDPSFKRKARNFALYKKKIPQKMSFDVKSAFNLLFKVSVNTSGNFTRTPKDHFLPIAAFDSLSTLLSLSLINSNHFIEGSVVVPKRH